MLLRAPEIPAHIFYGILWIIPIGYIFNWTDFCLFSFSKDLLIFFDFVSEEWLWRVHATQCEATRESQLNREL